MYTAFRAGRAEKDPSEFWYEGELGFFDFYIVSSLATKRKCDIWVSCHFSSQDA